MVTNQNSTSATPFHPISQKLDNSNFLLQRQQVEPGIKARTLQRFVASPQISMRFLKEADCEGGNENPTYSDWEHQDQILLSRLQSTHSVSILSRIIGCTHSYQLWEQIHEYFQKQTVRKLGYFEQNSELQCLSQNNA